MNYLKYMQINKYLFYTYLLINYHYLHYYYQYHRQY